MSEEDLERQIQQHQEWCRQLKLHLSNNRKVHILPEPLHGYALELIRTVKCYCEGSHTCGACNLKRYTQPT